MAQEKDKFKILIVDDVENNRFVLRDIIQEMGYMPILAANGVQALKVLDHIKPQLILLDVAMPEMDGYEFCQIIKKDPEKREIPVIFISAFDDPADIVKGFAMGSTDYIVKPFIPEVVKVRVGLHLKLYETNQEWQEANRLLQTSVSKQVKQIESEKKNMLHALARIARECITYDEDMMQRICYNGRVLAEAMQLSVEYGHLVSDMYIDALVLALPLCDLGQLALPTELLQKQELSPDENGRMQSHTVIGANILKDIQQIGDYNDFCQIAAEMAENHHENWDGTGYPAGKQGDEIPLSAQIAAIVCAYCAETNNMDSQDYQECGSIVNAMEAEAGKKYNPTIFKILQKVYRQFH